MTYREAIVKDINDALYDGKHPWVTTEVVAMVEKGEYQVSHPVLAAILNELRIRKPDLYKKALSEHRKLYPKSRRRKAVQVKKHPQNNGM